MGNKDDLYYKGYVAGYRDGINDGVCGKTSNASANSILALPLKAMNLSVRAHNCLSRAGCKYISDIVALNSYAIATMRNVGSKTASEIAHWLDDHGICYSAWSEYL